MKVLTLTQPWATLVAIGAKRIETRSWSTSYRGPLAIHAAKGYPQEARAITISNYPIAKALHNAGLVKLKDLPLGAIVATCELVKVVEISQFIRQQLFSFETADYDGTRCQLTGPELMCTIPPDEPELSFGDYTPGRYAWLLDNVQALETPIPAKGALGLWNFDLEKVTA
jgi:hypothetical protein